MAADLEHFVDDDVLVGAADALADDLDLALADVAVGPDLVAGGEELVDARAVAEARGGAHEVGVHLGGEGLDQLRDELIDEVIALLLDQIDGDESAGALKNLLQFLLRKIKNRN